MPEVALPKQKTKQYGVWLSNEDKQGDVHIRLNKTEGIVIGENLSYTDKINYSDIALVLSEDGLRVQYEENGEPVVKEIKGSVVANLLKDFLTKVKESV